MERLGGPIVLKDGTTAPLSKLVAANGLLFLSGQLAFDSEGGIEGETVFDQTLVALKNIESLLKDRGVDRKSIVRCTCWITREENFGEFNRAFKEFFGDLAPSRSTLRSDLLVPGALVEIEATALDGGGDV